MTEETNNIEEESKDQPEVVEEPVEASSSETEESIETLTSALREERERAEELTDRWKRSAAEFSNYRKRVEKERGELVKFSNTLLITKLLPILDDLQRAFQTLPREMRQFTWVDGIALVERKLAATLEYEGLSCIEALGKPFDPALHQAIMYEETTESDEGTVIEELQKGYKLHEKVIRPTLVKVAKNVPEAAPTEESDQPKEED